MLEIFINIKTEISLGSIAGNSQSINQEKKRRKLHFANFIYSKSIIDCRKLLSE